MQKPPCRCDRGLSLSPGADVTGVSPVPVRMWRGQAHLVRTLSDFSGSQKLTRSPKSSSERLTLWAERICPLHAAQISRPSADRRPYALYDSNEERSICLHSVLHCCHRSGPFTGQGRCGFGKPTAAATAQAPTPSSLGGADRAAASRPN